MNGSAGRNQKRLGQLEERDYKKNWNRKEKRGRRGKILERK
jgi:hypothetical protein